MTPEPADDRLISVVVPVLDEAESLPQLADELRAVSSEHGLDIEVVLVDDGSTDGTWQVIRDLAAGDPRFRGIRLRRNFGKAPALAAGFAAAGGAVVVTMDGDLQDDPAEVPKLLAALDSGYDTVSGWKRVRHDPWHKVWPSRAFNLVVSWLTGVRLHDVNCGLKCYRREALQEVALYGELHRFIPVLAHAKGFRAGEVEVRHRPRAHGRSKFGAPRLLRGLLDLLTVKFLTGYGTRPLHLLGGVGLLALVGGFAGLIYLAVLWLLGERPIGTRPLLTYSSMAVLLGAQMLALGFLAELLTAYHIRGEPPYSVAEQTNPPPAPAGG
jgi:glycosyltransferase involved in cell wall biosynthesis